MEKIITKELRNLFTIFLFILAGDINNFVFNWNRYIFGEVAREFQFSDHIDYFYNDIKIDYFLDAVLIRLNN